MTFSLYCIHVGPSFKKGANVGSRLPLIIMLHVRYKKQDGFDLILYFYVSIVCVACFLFLMGTDSLSELTSHEFKSEVQEFLRHFNGRERDPQRVQRKAAHIVKPEGWTTCFIRILTLRLMCIYSVNKQGRFGDPWLLDLCWLRPVDYMSVQLLFICLFVTPPADLHTFGRSILQWQQLSWSSPQELHPQVEDCSSEGRCRWGTCLSSRKNKHVDTLY